MRDDLLRLHAQVYVEYVCGEFGDTALWMVGQETYALATPAGWRGSLIGRMAEKESRSC